MVQKRSVETELYDFGVGLAPWPNSTLLVGARTLRKGSGTGTFVDSVGSIKLISLVGDNPPLQPWQTAYTRTHRRKITRNVVDKSGPLYPTGINGMV